MDRCVARSALLDLRGCRHARRRHGGGACQQTEPSALADLHGPDPPVAKLTNWRGRPAFGFPDASTFQHGVRSAASTEPLTPSRKPDIVLRGNRAFGSPRAVLADAHA